MIERRQRLTLVAEAAQNVLAVEAGLHHFDGHTLAILIVRTYGRVNDSHPTMTDLVQDLVGTETSADQFFRDAWAVE